MKEMMCLSVLPAFTEQYFRGDDITLNERFSAPQKGSEEEEEEEELMLDEGFDTER